jgi:hypothetical protein
MHELTLPRDLLFCGCKTIFRRRRVVLCKTVALIGHSEAAVWPDGHLDVVAVIHLVDVRQELLRRVMVRTARRRAMQLPEVIEPRRGVDEYIAPEKCLWNCAGGEISPRQLDETNLSDDAHWHAENLRGGGQRAGAPQNRALEVPLRLAVAVVSQNLLDLERRS